MGLEMERIRFGIIGSGYMAKMHSLALRNIGAFLWPDFPKIEMVRMADIVDVAASQGAERWGWSDHTTDWTRVTRSDDIDAVIIITPNDSHALYAIDAFEHGKHVFCEKPLANTVEAAERMALAAKKSLAERRTVLISEMTIGYKAIRERFSTRVTLDKAKLKILVEYVDGPFSHLENVWTFRPDGEDPMSPSCKVEFFIDYTFKNRMLAAIMGAMFDTAFRKFADAFVARADQVYGKAGK